MPEGPRRHPRVHVSFTCFANMFAESREGKAALGSYTIGSRRGVRGATQKPAVKRKDMTFNPFEESESLHRRSAEGLRCSATGPCGCKEDGLCSCWIDFEVQGCSQSSSRLSILDHLCMAWWHGTGLSDFCTQPWRIRPSLKAIMTRSSYSQPKLKLCLRRKHAWLESMKSPYSQGYAFRSSFAARRVRDGCRPSASDHLSIPSTWGSGFEVGSLWKLGEPLFVTVSCITHCHHVFGVVGTSSSSGTRSASMVPLSADVSCKWFSFLVGRFVFSILVVRVRVNDRPGSCRFPAAG